VGPTCRRMCSGSAGRTGGRTKGCALPLRFLYRGIDIPFSRTIPDPRLIPGGDQLQMVFGAFIRIKHLECFTSHCTLSMQKAKVVILLGVVWHLRLVNGVV
jgi:hypothetical protein